MQFPFATAIPWVIASFTGFALLVLGTGAIYGTSDGAGAMMMVSPFALLFTLPALLVRAAMGRTQSVAIAAVVGAAYGGVLFPVSYGLFEPLAGRASGQDRLAVLAVYLIAGACAGVIWARLEKRMKGAR